MRRTARPWRVRAVFASAVLCLALCASSVVAQEAPPENPRFPSLPLSSRESPTLADLAALPPPTTPINVPERVTLPAGSILNVVLETPTSTRIAKKNQKVTFRTVSPVHVAEGPDIPPETAIHGTIVEAKKPGSFGKVGVIRVKLDQFELTPNAPVPLVARLQSADMDKQGRIRADSVHGTDMIELAQYTLVGTFMGARIGGGKGAGIGAGAGALAALLIMMARRGPDVYLEPGMPFVVVVDEAVELLGQEVLDAQANYAKAHLDGMGVNAAAVDPLMGIPPNERPVLKRRPKKP
ncbi:MAG: hypothetical protein M1453_09900 [Acidobacteria bacterium]|nr:hypothetical protein [Acidobacteriota bacterium]MCL5288289.1 hypothetical protein [Acidobacteriota bacterium]